MYFFLTTYLSIKLFVIINNAIVKGNPFRVRVLTDSNNRFIKGDDSYLSTSEEVE